MSRPPAAPAPGGDTPGPDEDAGTGLPGLRTWRAVYTAVFAVFVLWLVLLAVFTRAFS